MRCLTLRLVHRLFSRNIFIYDNTVINKIIRGV